MISKSIKHFLYAIGFTLLLYINIPIWLFWFLPMKKRGTFESVVWDWDCWAFKWDVANDSDFCKSSMKNWWGFVLGSNIIFVDFKPGQDEEQEKHEETHVLQVYILNIFFYPMYILFCGIIWLFFPQKHTYYDNPLEMWARWAAGQQVKILPAQWLGGPDDRVPWF